jgi:hypothetical protein
MHGCGRVGSILGLAGGNSAIDAFQISPAQEIDDLLSRITLLSFTRNSYFVVYLSVVTASIRAGSAKHVSAPTLAP